MYVTPETLDWDKKKCNFSEALLLRSYARLKENMKQGKMDEVLDFKTVFTDLITTSPEHFNIKELRKSRLRDIPNIDEIIEYCRAQ